MKNVSDHTLQINAWIALCQIDPKFPDTLRRSGYTVDIIDPKFVHDDEEVNPDLILTSRGNNHSIIIDCKSNTLKKHQNERYSSIQDSPGFLLSRGVVSSAEASEDYEAEFVYSSLSNLSTNTLLSDTDFAVVHFDQDADQYIIRTLDDHEFNFERLQDQFPIYTDTEHIPTDYFPFDVGTGDDDYRQFTISVLQSTVHVALNQDEFNADDVLEDAHPLWIDLDAEKKHELRTHTETIINEYQNKGLDEHIQKIQASSREEWQVVSKSLQALQRKVDEFVDDVQTELEQMKITDDWATEE